MASIIIIDILISSSYKWMGSTIIALWCALVYELFGPRMKPFYDINWLSLKNNHRYHTIGDTYYGFIYIEGSNKLWSVRDTWWMRTNIFSTLRELKEYCKKELREKSNGYGCGDLMAIDEFKEAVDNGWFSDYDGHGRGIDENGYVIDKLIFPSMVEEGTIPNKIKGVVWYNK